MLWKLGVVAELIEVGTALLSAGVHSAAYVVYKRRQRIDCVNRSVARKTFISMDFG